MIERFVSFKWVFIEFECENMFVFNCLYMSDINVKSHISEIKEIGNKLDRLPINCTIGQISYRLPINCNRFKFVQSMPRPKMENRSHWKDGNFKKKSQKNRWNTQKRTLKIYRSNHGKPIIRACTVSKASFAAIPTTTEHINPISNWQ